MGGTSVFDPEPNAANITLLPGRIMVGKALVPVPDDMAVERRYLPCLCHLLPGEPFAEHILLATPLASCTWYEYRRMRTAPVRRALFFEMGYVVASAAAKQYIKRLDLPDGQTYAANSFLLQRPGMLRTGPLLETLASAAPCAAEALGLALVSFGAYGISVRRCEGLALRASSRCGLVGG